MNSNPARLEARISNELHIALKQAAELKTGAGLQMELNDPILIKINIDKVMWL